MMVTVAHATVKTTLLGAAAGFAGGLLLGPFAGAAVGLSGGLIGGAPAAIAGGVAGVAGGLITGGLISISVPVVLGAVAIGGGLLLARNLVKNNNSNSGIGAWFSNLFNKVNTQTNITRTPNPHLGSLTPSRGTTSTFTANDIGLTAVPSSQYSAVRGSTPRPAPARTFSDKIGQGWDDQKDQWFGSGGRNNRDGSSTAKFFGKDIPKFRIPGLDYVKNLLAGNRNQSAVARTNTTWSIFDADKGPERTPEDAGPDRTPEDKGPEKTPGISLGNDKELELGDSLEFRVRKQYQAAYNKYIALVQSGKDPNSPVVQKALADYRKYYANYIKLAK